MCFPIALGVKWSIDVENLPVLLGQNMLDLYVLLLLLLLYHHPIVLEYLLVKFMMSTYSLISRLKRLICPLPLSAKKEKKKMIKKTKV